MDLDRVEVQFRVREEGPVAEAWARIVRWKEGSVRPLTWTSGVRGGGVKSEKECSLRW